jgi:hypothetical protein
MTQWSWSAVIILSAVVAFVVDRLFWPDRVLVVLYAVPIALASRYWPPRRVVAIAISCLVAGVADLCMSGHASALDALGLVGLLVVGLLASSHAHQREELRRRLEQQRAVIASVAQIREPLAVIEDSAGRLNDPPFDSAAATSAIAAIREAAAKIRWCLDEVLARWGSGQA